MKDIKQIRESYLVLEKEDAEQKKLTTLVRAGLFDAKKLPMLRRALKKDAANMTPAEKNLLVDLLDSLMAQVLHSQQVYMKVRTNVAKKDMEELKEAADYLTKFDPRVKPGYSDKTDRQIPAVLILKRKAIRVYPDNQKVALYYAQALDQYITIPFGLEDSSGPASIKEEVELEEAAATGKDFNVRGQYETPEGTATITHRIRSARNGKHARQLAADKVNKKVYPKYKALRATLVKKENVQLDEISRELAQRAYMQRLKQTQGDDESEEAASKRAIAGVKASRTLRRIGTKFGEVQKAGTKAAGSQMLKNLEKEKKPIKRPVAADWSGVGNLIAHAIVDTGRGAARLAGVPKAKLRFEEETDIKSRFKKRVKEKREEQLDEIAFAPVIAGAARLAGAAAPYIGRGIAGAGRLAGRGIRGAGRLLRRGAGAALDRMLGGGGGDDKGPSAGEATAKSLGPVQAKEYQFQGGLAGGKMGAPGTRDVASATAQGDFRSPADQVKYLNAMMRESVNDIQVTFGEETVTINNNTAQKVLEVHNSLNEENKNKFETMLNESPASFRKAVNFALRY